MKKTFILSLSLLSLLVAGAGCRTAEPVMNTKPADLTTPSAMPTPETATTSLTTTAPITLDAEALGNGEVRLEWSFRDEESEADGFRIVRSKNPDPVHNNLNYWWQTNAVRRDTVWPNVTTGTQHFRICILDGEECTDYSSDVTLDVR